MTDCFDEGMLQSYCDAELAPQMMERVESHLAVCSKCKQAVAEVESENVLLSQGLEAEFAMSVPSERLRHRIDAVLAGETATAPATRRWFQSLAELFTLSPQRAFAYAGVAAIVLFAAIFVFVQYKNRQDAPSNPDQATGGSRTTAPKDAVVTTPEVLATASPAPDPAPAFTPIHQPRKNAPVRAASGNVAQVKLLPGERSYLKTIAALDNTIKAGNNKPMRPALQSEYERNLAMVNRAIAATRSAAKSNPNDPDAAEFMFAAYQTKVDFLNQVADSRLSNGRH